MARPKQKHVDREVIRALQGRMLVAGYTQRLLGCYVGICSTNLNKRLHGYLPMTVGVYRRLSGALDDFDGYCKAGHDLRTIILEEGRRYDAR